MPHFWDHFYHVSSEPDASFLAFVSSKFHMLQLMDKLATHAKPSFTDADVADFEAQLKRIATILSFQDWFAGTVLELSRQLPLSSHLRTSMSDILTALQELLYSVSRAGYNAQNHISHLLFKLVLRHCDTCPWDTFPALPAPTKCLLY